MKLSLLFLLASVLFFSCQSKLKPARESTVAGASYADSLTNELNKIHEQGHFNGLAVAIVIEDGTLYQNGFGFSDAQTKKKYTAGTIQNIGSVSKTFIGVALLKAQEMGKLHLDDPVNKYLPFEVTNPYFPNQSITIRHLATHTSTITDTEDYFNRVYILKDERNESENAFKELPQKLNPPEDRIPTADFLEKVLARNGEWYKKEAFLQRKPGELFEYSNVGATLAALVLEMATQESFDRFTAKHILEPLRMRASGWGFEQVDFSQFSTLYVNPQTEVPPYSLITYPDGGFITSVHDLGLYLAELIKGYSGQGTILSQDSYKELFTEQLEAVHFTERNENNPYNDEYNSGIFMGFSAKGYIGHTGGDPGTTSLMFFNADTKVGRIFITNTNFHNKEGQKQLWAVWDKLEEYSAKLAKGKDAGNRLR